MTAPFLRWVGGKSRIVDEVVAAFPADWKGRRYVEPFLGSGAVYLAIRGELFERGADAILSDASPQLVQAWRYAEPDLVERYGRGIVDESTYKLSRAAYNSGALEAKQAASMFVALNHTCYNGLWRVNQAGRFNVPYGKRSPDWDAVAHSVACRGIADVRDADAFKVVAGCGEGTLVYLDPPYLDTHDAYTTGGFGEPEHGHLQALAHAAVSRGAVVVASLSDTPEMRGLWSAWRLREVAITHSVGPKKAQRPRTGELIATM